MNQSIQNSNSQKSILLVDDKSTALGILSIILKKENFIVHEAVNDMDALSAYKECNHDIVLTDVDMPKIDGIELTKSIRKLCSNTPVIVMSSTGGNLQLAENAGANVTFHKPVSMSAILGVIRAYL